MTTASQHVSTYAAQILCVALDFQPKEDAMLALMWVGRYVRELFGFTKGVGRWTSFKHACCFFWRDCWGKKGMDTQHCLEMVHVMKARIFFKSSLIWDTPYILTTKITWHVACFLRNCYWHVWHEPIWRQDSGTLKCNTPWQSIVGDLVIVYPPLSQVGELLNFTLGGEF